MGGSDDELKCAEYIKKLCKEMNLGDAYIEPFEVDMATIKKASAESIAVTVSFLILSFDLTRFEFIIKNLRF